MKFEILRRKPGTESHWQAYEYTPAEPGETVATALTRLNEQHPDDPITWEHSCLQKKCGACAMVVNGRPMLACEAKLTELKQPIRIEPLRKFPVVADLMVDRSILFENLKALRLWFAEEACQKPDTDKDSFEASRCLQCGCCLEVCPNFYVGGEFTGMAGGVPMGRLLNQLPEGQRKEWTAAYRRRVYEGCGKSLACRNVCPAGIDMDRMLINSNAVAIWKGVFQGWRRRKSY